MIHNCEKPFSVKPLGRVFQQKPFLVLQKTLFFALCEKTLCMGFLENLYGFDICVGEKP
jgi:hypothetical protein